MVFIPPALPHGTGRIRKATIPHTKELAVFYRQKQPVSVINHIFENGDSIVVNLTVVKKLSMILFSTALFLGAHALTGRVTDRTGAALEDATINVVNAALSTKSGSDGTWRITVPSSTQPFLRKRIMPAPVLNGTTLNFGVDNEIDHVKVSVYTLDGRFMYTMLDQTLTAGYYRVNPFGQSTSTNTYMIKLEIGNAISCFHVPVIHHVGELHLTRRSVPTATAHRTLEKRSIEIDNIVVSKKGFTTVVKSVYTYDDTIDVVLDLYTPSYYRNPPNPCYNQFYVNGCIKGEAKSTCGGECTVANSCSPPEDQSKADRPKTFICPRFMLYSTEMLQAAKDDAKLYGWSDGEDAPFTYGVVGHDPDVGGVDDISSSCCQCYQIIFQKPEPSSPQPPDLPYPKPLIVQSFNTAASGPKGFDVFMGAGGYGAFNSCYNDPAFGNTSKFTEYIYDGYPYQNPGSGGISFLRYQECLKGWPVTVEGVQSSPCQDKIRQMCNQAQVNSSSQITEDTRRSCIETNKIESLYHQNWEVIVKRVRCPENLTRVTGCRLKEPTLPLPYPKVQTPQDALANGTFRTGYHTTTMQDCCKPTCAWSNWVSGYKLPVDGEWDSFYSCDKNGVPFTR
jgi:hypothetical protein